MPVRLVLTLKHSVRRCLYRRWEAAVKGKVLTTKTTTLERLYRGNTPYPVGKVRQTAKTYDNRTEAKRMLMAMSSRRKILGYKPS